MRRRRRIPHLSSAFAVLTAAVVAMPLAAQGSRQDGAADRTGTLDRPDALAEVLDRVDGAHGLLVRQLVEGGSDVEPLLRFVRGDGLPEDRAEDRADRAARDRGGYDLLGERAAAVLRRGQAFRREVISILADSDGSGANDEAAATALRGAVTRYLSRPEIALPAAPKNMDVLYDHQYALRFRTDHPSLSGLLWAGQWLRLAATEPLTDLPQGTERSAGLDTVVARYLSKLSGGEPPHAFPSELPLAPAIAPGLIWLSPESAMIWDNLSMLTEVIADILAASQGSGRAALERDATIAAAVNFFTEPDRAVTEQIEWEVMALRHGIFFQGGYPLAVMTRSERNGDSHMAHMRRGGPMVIPGMIGR